MEMLNIKYQRSLCDQQGFPTQSSKRQLPPFHNRPSVAMATPITHTCQWFRFPSAQTALSLSRMHIHSHWPKNSPHGLLLGSPWLGRSEKEMTRESLNPSATKESIFRLSWITWASNPSNTLSLPVSGSLCSSDYDLDQYRTAIFSPPTCGEEGPAMLTVWN